jgi:5-methylcytosine-specific restriction endonuclease McrA
MSAGSRTDIDSKWNDPTTYDGSYPPDWDARRKSVYRRDDWTCTNCGTKSGPHTGRKGVPLHAHHEHPLSQGGSNHLSNLTTLCESCHNLEHDHDITAEMDRYTWLGRVKAWFRQLVRYLAGAVVCLVLHLGIAMALSGTVSIEPIERYRWLLTGGYCVSLLGLTYSRPRTVSIVFGLSGGLSLALVYVLPSLSNSPTNFAVFAGLFWLPAALAGGWALSRQ